MPRVCCLLWIPQEVRKLGTLGTKGQASEGDHNSKTR